MKKKDDNELKTALEKIVKSKFSQFRTHRHHIEWIQKIAQDALEGKSND